MNKLKQNLSSLITFIFITYNLSEQHQSSGGSSTTTSTSNHNNNLCQNVWKFPPNCQGNCTYQLVWRFKPQDDSIEFIVSSKHAQRWTGIGFAQDKSLQNSDAIFAWIEENTRYVMMDAFLPTYQTPISDKLQSISNISATVSNGLISFRFTRKRNTGDSQEDLLFNDEKCLYLIYPVEGGSVDIKNRAVITNEFIPHVSDTPVCIRACNYVKQASHQSIANNSTSTTTTTTTTTSQPNELILASSSNPSSTPAPPVQHYRASGGHSSRPRLHFPSQTSTRAPNNPLLSTTSSTTTTSTTTTTTTTTARPTITTTSTTTTTRPPPTTTSTTTPPPPPPTTTTTTTTTPKPTTTTSTTTTTTTTTPRPSTTTTTTTTTPTIVKESIEQFAKVNSAPKLSSESSSQQRTNQQDHLQALATTTTAINSNNDPQWCVGRWSYPQNCRFQAASQESNLYLQQAIDSSTNIKPLPLELSDCSYLAQWKYLEPTDSIEFIIQTKTRLKWTGIGFSNGTRMANSDAIIGILDEINGRHFIMDTWLRDHIMPEIDINQNTDHTWAKRENGTTTMKFRRKRLTLDSSDFQFTDDSCAYFFFPTQGGVFNAISKRLLKHDVIPSVSRNKICIRSCTKRPVDNQNTSTGAGGVITPLVTTTTTSSQLITTTATDPSLSVSDGSSVVGSSSSSGANQAVINTANRAGGSSNNNNNLLLLSSTTSSTTTVPTVSSSTTSPVAQPAPPQIKNPDSTNSINLSPSNDLNAELDSSSQSQPTSGSGGQDNSSPLANNKALGTNEQPTTIINNPFNKLTFLAEPSIRWLAVIGVGATVAALIVFQACFSIYRNKQAYKQSLYRESALKQNSYLHGAYITDSSTDQQPSTGSDETQTAAILHNSYSSSNESLAGPTTAAALDNGNGVPQQTSSSHHHHLMNSHHHQHHSHHHHPHHSRHHHQQRVAAPITSTRSHHNYHHNHPHHSSRIQQQQQLLQHNQAHHHGHNHLHNNSSQRQRHQDDHQLHHYLKHQDLRQLHYHNQWQNQHQRHQDDDQLYHYLKNQDLRQLHYHNQWQNQHQRHQQRSAAAAATGHHNHNHHGHHHHHMEAYEEPEDDLHLDDEEDDVQYNQ